MKPIDYLSKIEHIVIALSRARLSCLPMRYEELEGLCGRERGRRKIMRALPLAPSWLHGACVRIPCSHPLGYDTPTSSVPEETRVPQKKGAMNLRIAPLISSTHQVQFYCALAGK